MIKSGKLDKDITFIYLDNAQKQMFEPIIAEAERRGYRTTLTDDKFAKSEIGIYCEHVNHPQYSKFSIIMLHDIIQQYSNWPDIWYREPWDKYDIGILPSTTWVENWQLSSGHSYAHPRMGVFLTGWPKADLVCELSSDERRNDLLEKIGLDKTKKTVLYAPSWENDGKQDDFVQAMLGLDVNILVKQAAWNKELYPEIYSNIEEMYALHRDLERVKLLPPETNIFTAIAVSDILVSEESSTMCEAAMMGVPAISVSDWLIPDVTPSRFPKCDYDFVVTTVKSELANCVTEMLDDYGEACSRVAKYAEANFSNIGNSSAMILDIIDDCIVGEPIRYPQINGVRSQRMPIGKEIYRRLWNVRREISSNYSKRNPIVGVIWTAASRAAHVIRTKNSAKKV